MKFNFVQEITITVRYRTSLRTNTLIKKLEKSKIDRNHYKLLKSVSNSINKLMDLIWCNATETIHCK
ncbi:hypothetical protein C8E03_1342 [Lachnotalea glycerini]|uniref:Uncharacterized protein n=1 Tax=Lachnotalea glycerini TaxID=1763509 RepID=A0A318EG19_9FIRM|nr:hypothetical protein C8E03_1342 [Lachnotalea glycerini]